MSTRWHQQGLLFLAVLVLQSCVTVYAPLLPDEEYPRDWGELSALGPECKGVDGTYSNAGRKTGTSGSSKPVSLMEVLDFVGDAKTVSLNTYTRRIDRNGDAFITLRISAHGNATVLHEREGCFCIKQTLACTQLSEKYWSFPNFGLGGSQSNAYFAISRDRTLIAKLQNYHADVILGVPIFGTKEQWARFENADHENADHENADQ
jgi:hypothetical protein